MKTTIKTYNDIKYATIEHDTKFESFRVNEIQLFQNTDNNFAVVLTDGYQFGSSKIFKDQESALDFFYETLIKIEQNEFDLDLNTAKL